MIQEIRYSRLVRLKKKKKNLIRPYVLEEIATNKNFDEVSYLLVNQDVAAAIASSASKSLRNHFNIYENKMK